jgi:hypothetical protein
MLTAVLAELRADELVRADIGDIRPTDEGGVIHVHGKGNKERRIPVEQALIHELEAYLESRADRFPNSTKRGPRSGGLAAWPDTAPLFVGRRRLHSSASASVSVANTSRTWIAVVSTTLRADSSSGAPEGDSVTRTVERLKRLTPVSDSTSAQDTLDSLQAQGYKVVNKVGNAPLGQCTVSAVRPGRNIMEPATSRESGSLPVHVIRYTTVDLDVKW